MLRKRADGFHDLSTVMAPVRGLYDIITIEASEQLEFSQVGIVVDCPIEKNLCIKAFRAMQQRYDIGNIAITLDKRVPFGAGLGGGSSDATAVIVGINDLFALGISEQELIDVAAQIGSDTPFFVRNTPQICSGRGEIMEDIELPLSGLWLAVAKPAEGVSTAEAYGGVKPAEVAVPLTERLKAPIAKWRECIKNDFEPHIFATHPAIAQIKQHFYDCGALYTSMSGSGSAVFALFESEPKVVFDSTIFTHIEQL